MVCHDDIDLPLIQFGQAEERRTTEAYSPVKQLKNGQISPVRGTGRWKERHLEDHLERYWSFLNFGLGHNLELIGRQVRLSNTNEKVDLLASTGNIVIPIELKIKRAGGSDLTQLLSYRQDILNQGFAEENVIGVLVAPQFSHKVLNVISGTKGIVLRWVQVPV